MRDCAALIRAKVSTEGLPVPRDIVVASVVKRLERGYDSVIDCGALVFTVSNEPRAPWVHVYGGGRPGAVLSAGRDFMRRVWEETKHEFLIAPIKEPTIRRAAERAGWKQIAVRPWGHAIYRIERPKNGCCQ